MDKVIRNLGELMLLLFHRNEYRIDHPCVYTKDQAVKIDKEYLFIEGTLPAIKVVVKRIHLNIDCIKLKLLSVTDKKSFWISQSFDEQYWCYDEWRLLDTDMVKIKNYD
jgi:hypothetical protein